MKKLTKEGIEKFAQEIIEFLKEHNLSNGVCIYFNNKRIEFTSKWDREKKDFIYSETITEDISPLDYFEANTRHILSMSFEGSLYDVINGYNSYTWSLEEKFSAIFKKYGVYYEQFNAWNLSVYPDTIDEKDIEYTPYERELESINIHSFTTASAEVPIELILIKHMWDRLSATTVHLGGSITTGDGFEFTYKENKYHMMTPAYQCSLIYEHWIDTIKHELKTIGAEGIYYNYGRLD